MTPEFDHLFCQHAILGYEKQLAFADVVGERNWNFDTPSGQLTFEKQGFFGKPLVFSVQLLGTASEGDSSWMWSWANEASNLPPQLTVAAAKLKALGVSPEFSERVFSIDFETVDDHRIAMAVTGLLGASAYYRGPYGGGAAYFMIQDNRVRLSEPDLLRVARLVPEAISAIPVHNHREAVVSYARQRGFDIREEADKVAIILNGQELAVSFDELNRVTELAGRVGPG